jgi:hypothetical protein
MARTLVSQFLKCHVAPTHFPQPLLSAYLPLAAPRSVASSIAATSLSASTVEALAGRVPSVSWGHEWQQPCKWMWGRPRQGERGQVRGAQWPHGRDLPHALIRCVLGYTYGVAHFRISHTRAHNLHAHTRPSPFKAIVGKYFSAPALPRCLDGAERIAARLRWESGNLLELTPQLTADDILAVRGTLRMKRSIKNEVVLSFMKGTLTPPKKNDVYLSWRAFARALCAWGQGARQ